MHAGGRVDVMQSSGGIISGALCAPEPVRTVLSGPAGGVIGACQVARWAGFERIIGFDMGGTSTDVFLADVPAAACGSRANRSWPACRSACRCSIFIPPAPAADRLRASMPAACCAWGRSRRARSRGQSVLAAERCRL